MIGIGHRQEKYTKIKLLAEKAKQYNTKYDSQIEKGAQPSDIIDKLKQEEYQKRHQGEFIEEPYKISGRINQIGGALHLGYTQTHKTLSETQQFYAPMQSVMQAKKTGTASSFKVTRTQQEIDIHNKMKERIQKDHLQEDKQIDFGDKIESDYKRHFKEDEKMKQIRETKDKQFNQRKNDLKWYAETYIKTKDSLRKC